MIKNLALQLLLVSSAFAGERTQTHMNRGGVYPRPQQTEKSAGWLHIGMDVKAVGADKADADAVALLRDLLKDARSGEGKLRVVIGERGDPAVAGLKLDMPKVSGAYALSVARDGITVVGHDERGTFYGVQTLRQLLHRDDSGRTSLPLVEITDWPDILFRGTVEGFYGTPWSHKKRLSQLRFYGRWKMNTYIYGPKDDPYHSSPNWRKPYPEKEAGQIKELAKVANENKVDFVWAIHPGKDIKWTDEDQMNVIKKFEMMYDLGVRSFAVFFDDISGEGTNPKRQAELLNMINDKFITAKKDCTPLVMCPTQYNRGWSSGDYLDILGTELDRSIHIMWTGNTVVHDIKLEGQDWINARIKRPSYVWLNWPVSDFVRNHLLMGRFYGSDTSEAAKSMCSGFVSNPMERSEASKVGLFSIADYSWNILGFDSQSAWQQAIREVVPQAPEAFATFCAHNSHLGPNYHGYSREESVAIAPAAESFSAQFDADGSLNNDYAAVLDEFRKIAAAPETIRANCDNADLIEEIDPWLLQFEQLGIAGRATLEMAKAYNGKDPARCWALYLEAKTAFDQMAVNHATLNQNGWQNGVHTGSLVMMPLAEKVFETTASRFYSTLSGRPIAVINPITSMDNDVKNIESMTDGKEDTYAYFQQIQKVGDYVGLDLGPVQPVHKVEMVLGRKDGDHDMIHKGQLEYSDDKKNWKALGPETTGERVSYGGKAVQARYVRYRSTHAGKLDGSKNDVWVAVRSFKVNPVTTEPRFLTNVDALSKTPIQKAATSVAVSPQFEVVKLQPGQFFGIEIQEGVVAKAVTVDLKVDNAASCGVIEVSRDGGNWKKVATAKKGSKLVARNSDPSVRFFRFINNTRSAKEVVMQAFQVDVTKTEGAAGGAGPMFDNNLDTSYKAKLTEALTVKNNDPGARKVIVLLGPENGKTFAVVANTASGKRVLGKTHNGFGSFKLTAPTRSIELKSERYPADIEVVEVVWKKKGDQRL